MPIKDDIRSLSHRAVEALNAKFAQLAFEPFSSQINRALTELEEERTRFLASSSAGSPALRAAVELAATRAEAMTPAPASVDTATAAAHDASTALRQAAASRNLMEKLRGSLRIGGAAPALVTPSPSILKGNLDVGVAEVNTSATPPPPPPPSPGDPNYYQKLTNLFPAEALAIYGTGVGLYGRATLFVVVVGLAILVILRWFATQPSRGGPPQIVALAVAALSYLFWVTATDPGWLADMMTVSDPEIVRRTATFIGAAFVVVAPLIVRPSAQPAG
ncbi:hypothetical protein ASE86_03795 [Sphingomonas sp. Leaf33]|uniref:hypothetical protein n=1 Tax=Sphingomonas sp. Leaf33 TaxID=1736215 RepID=UPI0007012E35|nr:hypothetical protein [Sphingomonas sp. Leaf33]KQN25374.1 hypothetical protein ASE86_03795 [Sphingomonas sp. Leaf33]